MRPFVFGPLCRGFSVGREAKPALPIEKAARGPKDLFDWTRIMNEDKALFPPVDPYSAGVRGCCPRCGQGKLFNGLLKVRPACTNCGLDYSFADSGDGPVVFVLLIVGFIVVGIALWAEVNYALPLWLHFILWIPLAIGLGLWLTRILKGLLITLQYRNNARPGEIDRG
jgi:uncharacterized protein (DUF983 family)